MGNTEIPKIEKEKSSEKEKKEVIVEIGTNMVPLSYFSTNFKEAIKKDALYVGIEKVESELQNAYKEDIDNFVVGDLKNIPLKDNTVNQLWLFNVFGSKNISIYDALKEMSRVLKIKGEIIIGETYTPKESLLHVDYEQYGFQKKILLGKEFVDFLSEKDLLFSKQEEIQQFIIILKKIK